ncbi:type II toxin-antitoxin system VapC family toxin [Agromyces italicus]|uniref:type II toxin-antitoxin system VapC family toxin n=1 Tax=Agromyces italicus TaxID=279572 RepID=UPI0003B72F67|nr:type II toxin-antitoxin system VapC family toxin [Agromyces italicus]
MIIVDTNVWSEALRPAPDERVLAWLRENSAGLHLTVVSVHELRYGVRLLPAGRRRDELDDQIEQLLVPMRTRLLEYDEAAARAHAEVRAEARRLGRTLSSEDGQVLGIALAHDAPIATRNVRDFAGLGAKVVDPWAR